MNAFIALDDAAIASATAVQPRWTVSIVSHGHGAAVARAVRCLSEQLGATPHEFVVTLNIPEAADFLAELPAATRWRVRLRRNARPRGFAANHNAALQEARGTYVLVADPDLVVGEAIFPALEAALAEPGYGIVSPLAQHPNGFTEDNGRPLVTPGALMRRYLIDRHRRTLKVPEGTPRQDVDWVAGLFMAMRAETFRRLGGFDEGFHMYCEDVDLCLRARRAGLNVALLPELRITHAARRRTLKRREHFRWHVKSLLRLWRSEAYRDMRRRAA